LLPTFRKSNFHFEVNILGVRIELAADDHALVYGPYQRWRDCCITQRLGKHKQGLEKGLKKTYDDAH
jgi:hypothetical protein